MYFSTYSNAMHDYMVTELELGHRVAVAQDSEDAGFSALFDVCYMNWVREDMKRSR